VNYCAVADVRNALSRGGASSGTNTASDLSDAQIADAIAEASAVVDVSVNGPYDPCVGDVVPGIITFWTRDIAAYLATLTWRASKDITERDPVVLRYTMATSYLNRVASGSMVIPMPSAPGDVATVINTYEGYLFHSWNFDLTGRSEGIDEFQGFPIWRSGAMLYWAA
jgi:phage gp36-like protein